MWLPLKRNINHERMRMTLIVCNSKYRYGEAAVEGGGERQVHGGMGNSK